MTEIAISSEATEPLRVPAAAAITLICAHCGATISNTPKQNLSYASILYCCLGCETVYNLLHTSGLDEFYKLRQPGDLVPIPPDASQFSSYSYLDESKFRELYSKADLDQFEARFYLEGIQCLGCLWLLEKLPALVPLVIHSRLDMSQSILTLKVHESGKLSEVAQTLRTLGYTPHPLRTGAKADDLRKQEDRRHLIKLGIAGACTGNIMLMAIPLYAGLAGSMATIFSWIMGALFLPICFYSAIPLYQSVLNGFRTRTLSIDLPIVAAILAGLTISFWNLYLGTGKLYFDSTSMLVFLILSSRYALRRLQAKFFGDDHFQAFLFPATASRWSQETRNFETVPAEHLQIGDVVQVNRGEKIPADGRIIKGETYADLSLLTGESEPVFIKTGDLANAGATNDDQTIEIKISASGADTTLGKILAELKNLKEDRSNTMVFTNRIGEVFTIAVLCVSVLLFFLFPFNIALERALTVTIISCPCVLAFSIPLVMVRVLGAAARAGILIKGEGTIEALAKIKNIVFDKTGTLTCGEFKVFKKEILDETVPALQILAALERLSKHPIARVIRMDLERQNIVADSTVTNVTEEFGRGVKGLWNGQKVEVTSDAAANVDGFQFSENNSDSILYKNILVTMDNRPILRVLLGDRFQPSIHGHLATLKSYGWYLLSGDTAANVELVRKTLGFPKDHSFSSLTPSEKLIKIKEIPASLFVGDGANDSLALKAATVGLAVKGSVELSLRSAHIFSPSLGIEAIPKLLSMGKKTMTLIHRNLFVTAAYNIVSLAFAVSGAMTPLLAAIIMPLSSLTVIAMTFLAREEG